MTWLDEAKRRDAREIAASLGLTVQRGGRFGPCPVCGDAREKKTARPACRIDAGRWFCNAGCGTSGDGIDLVAAVLQGARFSELQGPAQGTVIAWFTGDAAPAQASPVMVEPELDRGDPGALALVLKRSTLAGRTGRPDVLAWLAERGISTAGLPAWVLPEPAALRGLPVPGRWCAEYPLVVPAYTSAGVLASLHGRRVGRGDTSKTRWLSGVSASGLIFADPWRALPALRGADVSGGLLAIVEGMPDYLLTAQRGRSEGYPVIGVEAGSAGALRAARLPKVGAAVVATHDDEAGDAYFDEVAAALYDGHGLAARRVRWPEARA